MKKAAVLLSVCLLLGSCRGPGYPPIPSVETSGFLPAVREKIDRAREVAQSRPEDPQAVGAFCMALHAHRVLDAAGSCYERARALDPKRFEWAYYHAVVLAESGSGPAASSSFEAALGMKPEATAARLRYANQLLQQQQVDRAATEYRRVAGSSPDSAAAWYGLGRCAIRQKNHQGAIEFLERSAELERSGATYFALSQAYALAGDRRKAEEARAVREQLGAAEPGFPDPWLDALSQEQKGAYSLMSRAVQASAEGKLTLAATLFEEAAKADPRDVAPHYNLISVYGQLGRIADAERHYHHATQVEPKSVETHFNYAVLLARTERNDEAEKAFERVLSLSPGHASALVNLGYLKEARGELNQALSLYRKAVEADRADATAHFRLGRLLLQKGELPRAIEHLKIPAEAGDAQAAYGLAVAYRQAGDARKASLWAGKAAGIARHSGDRALEAAITQEFPH